MMAPASTHVHAEMKEDKATITLANLGLSVDACSHAGLRAQLVQLLHREEQQPLRERIPLDCMRLSVMTLHRYILVRWPGSAMLSSKNSPTAGRL